MRKIRELGVDVVGVTNNLGINILYEIAFLKKVKDSAEYIRLVLYTEILLHNT